MSNFFRSYLLPGLLFQSVIIGGGYSTGRELVEYFMSTGAISGLLGMLITMFTWSLLLALTFEFCRVKKTYDYRAFFGALLGRGWFLFELLFIAIAILVFAVIGAASGVIFSEMTGAPEHVGTALMILSIGVLAFYGTTLIEKMISAWSFVLYGAYLTLFIVSLNALGNDVSLILREDNLIEADALSALKYAGYNLAAVPAILFGITHIKKRKQAIWAGILSGPIAMLPAIMFYVVLLAQYPMVLNEDVPLLILLTALNTPVLALLFKIVIFGTYIETGVAMVHSVNERIDGFRREQGKELSHWQRVMIAACLLLFSIYLASSLGLVTLIGQGYGTITYGILALYVIPLLTVGLAQLRQA